MFLNTNTVYSTISLMFIERDEVKLSDTTISY